MFRKKLEKNMYVHIIWYLLVYVFTEKYDCMWPTQKWK
jgi:hypothetical protein